MFILVTLVLIYEELKIQLSLQCLRVCHKCNLYLWVF